MPMVLEMDNLDAVDLANNCNISRNTRHVFIKQAYRNKLKVKSTIKVVWVPEKNNHADFCMHNID